MHCQEFHIPTAIVTPTFEDSTITEEERAQAWSYLSSINTIPNWGDLVIFDGVPPYRNEGVCISNGIEIVELDFNIDDYGALPSQFTVIEGNRPLTYWADQPPYRGITHNSIVWYPYSQHSEELKANLTYGFDVVEGKFMLWSTFTYQGSQHKLIYDYIDYVYETYGREADWADGSLSPEELEAVKAKFIEDLAENRELWYQSNEYTSVALYLRPVY